MMDYKDKLQVMYQTKDGRYIAILKDDYRLDGSMVIEGDLESVIADVLRADRWVTINGSHVLIGKDGNIVAGMGGQFNGFPFGANFRDKGKTTKSGRKIARLYKAQKANVVHKNTKTDKLLYNRDRLGEIAKKCSDFKKSVEYGNQELGLRIQMKDTETIGKRMKHRSRNFGDDFETKAELKKRNGELLDGVSTVGLNLTHEVDKYGGYEGKVVYLLAGEKAKNGYDAGEKIIKSPKVLAKFAYKNGELIELGSVKITMPKKKVEKPKTPSKEYTSFLAQMEKKYGKEDMYGAMSDAEFDKYQYLENHKYDYLH